MIELTPISRGVIFLSKATDIAQLKWLVLISIFAERVAELIEKVFRQDPEVQRIRHGFGIF